MIKHVLMVYRSSGIKPAIKAALHDMRAGAAGRRQRQYYMGSLFSEEQREKASIDGYRIIKTDGVKLHRDMVCELGRTAFKSCPAFIYMDELKNGELLYKPDYAPDNLDAHNYMGNCVVVREDMLDDTARELAKEASLWSFNRYICNKCRQDEIFHVKRALYEDGAAEAECDEEVYDSTVYDGALCDGIMHDEAVNNGTVKEGFRADGEGRNKEGGNKKGRSGNGSTSMQPLISVIIPNCEHAKDLRRCVDSLLYTNSYRNIEIIIVENNSKSEDIFAYYRELEREHADVVRVIEWKGSFNYSVINNFAAAQAKGELLLLLNNDTKLLAPESLEEMAAYAVREDTGAVGACLLYQDKTVQHAGVIVGIGPDRTAVHPNSGVPFIEKGYRDSIHHVQNYSAVTGACLMVKKELFDMLHGLDEELAVAYNDVDFCLRLRRRGLLNVYVPQALLYHYESRSRGYDDKGGRRERLLKEAELFKSRWQAFIDDGDPYYNPNLSKERPWEVELNGFKYI